jgi:hypothetical protein
MQMLPTKIALMFLPVCVLIGCGKNATDPMERAEPPKPREAATQLEQAFAAAGTDIKAYASTAAQALQTADFEGAVQSLQMIKERGSLTVDQGMAVHNSMVSLEARLITAIAEGDPNAKRAYEQLKNARRN